MRRWGVALAVSALLVGACGGSNDVDDADSRAQNTESAEKAADIAAAATDPDQEVAEATPPSSHELKPGADAEPGCAPGLIWYNGITDLLSRLGANPPQPGVVQSLTAEMGDALAELASAQLPAATAPGIEFGKLLASGLLAEVKAAQPAAYPELLTKLQAQLSAPETQERLQPLADYFRTTCGLGAS